MGVVAFGTYGFREIHLVVLEVLLRIDLRKFSRQGSEVTVASSTEFEAGGDDHRRRHLAVRDVAAEGFVAHLTSNGEMGAFLPKIVLVFVAFPAGLISPMNHWLCPVFLNGVTPVPAVLAPGLGNKQASTQYQHDQYEAQKKGNAKDVLCMFQGASGFHDGLLHSPGSTGYGKDLSRGRSFRSVEVVGLEKRDCVKGLRREGRL